MSYKIYLKKKMISFLFCIFLFLNFKVCAQILNGKWTGNYAKTHIFSDPQSLIVNISIHDDSIITGTSHLLYKNRKYEHHKISGIFNIKDSSLYFKESLVNHNIDLGSVYEVTYKMKLKSVGNFWRLQGKWKGTRSTFGYLPYNKVWLEKMKDTLSNKKNDSISAKRKTDVQQVVEISKIEKDSIRVSIFDNGEIDGDSISVYLDDSLIINNVRISDKPISFKLSLSDAKQFYKIKMVAENLGEIPPNTALMIIETLKNRYEIRLSSDFNKNAVVEFMLKE